MKFELQLDNSEDLEYFRTLFSRNVGIEQMMYEFYTDGIMVRLQVNGLDGSQLVRVGVFDYQQHGKSKSLTQLCPVADARFSSFDEIQCLWYWNANEAWASITHGPSEKETQSALDKLCEILNIIHKVCKLKAFT